MVLLPSKEKAIGWPCPDFSLRSVENVLYKLKDFNSSRSLLVAFICNHCPYVLAIEDRLIKLAHEFPNKDLQVVGICSNDSKAYPDDAPEKLFKRWKEKGYGFPYLIDESQEVALAFDAQCTPDLFLFDAERKLFYHGRFDDNWQKPSLVKKEDLRLAVLGLLKGDKPPSDQKPSMGCSIKWKR